MRKIDNEARISKKSLNENNIQQKSEARNSVRHPAKLSNILDETENIFCVRSVEQQYSKFKSFVHVRFFSQSSFRSSDRKQRPAVFRKTRCFEKFCKFHRKTPVLVSHFNKVADLQACNFIKEAPAQVFSCKIHETFKNTHLKEHLRTTASERSYLQILAAVLCHSLKITFSQLFCAQKAVYRVLIERR